MQNSYKFLLTLFLGCILLCSTLCLIYFSQYIYSYNYFFYKNLIFSNKFNLMGYSLYLTGILTGLVVYWLGDSRVFFNKPIVLLVFLWFFVLIWFFINETNYIKLFIFYELFLLPSFFIVYYVSPNRRSIPVSIYFLTWTQFGSLFVLLAIIYIYLNTKSVYLIYNNNLNYSVVYLLFFIGFGIKVPMWPFYYWLTKTHVEASSFFSIYLSGFLVKTAIYLFNFFHAFYYNFNYINFLYIVVVIGIIDSSIKMWHQQDLKKLIAYTTVQEMNMLFIPLLWHSELTELYSSLFIIIHCLLSSIFFFIIDILVKRFGTRVNTQITGLIHIMPKFVACMFISVIFFTGLPYTAKFFIEILLFNLMSHYNFESFLVIIVVVNWFGVIGFCKLFFNVFFGSPLIVNKITYDLTKRELFMFLFLNSCLFVVCYITNSLL